MGLQGHQGNQLISLEFLPTGWHLASGGDDSTVRIWDLRKKQCIYTSPAQDKLVSSIKFENNPTARLMFTTSYDQKCRIWGAKSILQGENIGDEWVLLRTLAGHENKVTSVSFTKDLKRIITTSFDRTFKLWQSVAQNS